ncbi:hypothetical protein [Sorangium sp. So ce1335]|uniref:hypothetical protein n=1 Tax=Sorangium sp. So ce1335 TaxID=3133335 RepID=UPI003F5F0AE8
MATREHAESPRSATAPRNGPPGPDSRRAPKKSGRAPAPKKSGRAPAPKKSGRAPAPKKSGRAPAPKKSGRAPAPKGQPVPAERAPRSDTTKKAPPRERYAQASLALPSLTFAKLFTQPLLLKTWSRLCKEFHKHYVRDCIDHLDMQASASRWIRALWHSLRDGSYYPTNPDRAEESKSRGAFRTLTVPILTDVLVYRHIADAIYASARPYEPENAFFSQRHGKHAIGPKVDKISNEDYQYFFHIWLRYNQYRSSFC